MISKYGEVISKIRAKQHDSLRKMALKVDLSATYLSAMEVGRRKVPMELADKIRTIYQLTDEEYTELIDSINDNNEHVDIEMSQMNDNQKEVSVLFARTIHNADPELVEKLKKVLLEANEKD